jgi:GNAT superfamily N-acetyltransferase
MSAGLRIRPARSSDVELIFSLIVELAEYEHAAEQVTGSPELLGEALFGAEARTEAAIAEVGGTPGGFALFYATFSTWECRPGIWLEDLYIRPAHRRSGVGGALLAYVAGIAVERSCARLEWAALDWNAPALRFYERLGASLLAQWQMYRLDGAALERVAVGSGAAP